MALLLYPHINSLVPSCPNDNIDRKSEKCEINENTPFWCIASPPGLQINIFPTKMINLWCRRNNHVQLWHNSIFFPPSTSYKTIIQEQQWSGGTIHAFLQISFQIKMGLASKTQQTHILNAECFKILDWFDYIIMWLTAFVSKLTQKVVNRFECFFFFFFFRKCW